MTEMNPQGNHPVNPSVQFEATDANTNGVLVFGAGLCVVCALCISLLWWMYVSFISHENAIKRSDSPWSPAERAGVAQTATIRPSPLEPGTPTSGLDPRPRLEGLGPYDIGRNRTGTALEQHREDDAFLATAGWLDRKQGIVHIPIEQAMSKLADKLPARKGTATDEFLQAPSRSSSGRSPRGERP